MADDRTGYQAVEDTAVACYEAGRYAEGVAVVRAAMPDLPTYLADLAHLAACLLASDGRPGEAFAELSAALDAGAWWHRRILVEDDDLADLRAVAGFDVLVEKAHARALAAGDQAGPPVLRRPAGVPKGVLVALHGAGENAGVAATAWALAADAGLLVLAVESTQRNTPTYRSWPDDAVGVRDIEAALATLTDAEQSLPLIAAGFSAGGRQAIRWSLAGRAAAFVAMAPAIWPEQLDADAVTAAARRGLTGHVLLGEDDDDVRDGAVAATTKLREYGVVCELDIVPGLGHTFPTDFAERLRSSLARRAAVGGGINSAAP